MYTGIIENTGTLASLEHRGKGAVIKVKTPEEFRVRERVHLGDSVALNGVCVTAITIDPDGFSADLSAETMALTCFQYYRVGQSLNLELPCTPTTHLGGHIVQGHVDGMGEIVSMQQLDEAMDVTVKAPKDLLPYIAHKGSITVDGASLTVNGLRDDQFRLTLIPHTMETLAFENWKAGTKVNLEVDIIARYLERMVDCKYDAKEKQGLTYQTLVENGF